MRIRKRLKPDEAKYLGLQIKKQNGRKNPQYDLKEHLLEKLQEFRDKKYDEPLSIKNKGNVENYSDTIPNDYKEEKFVLSAYDSETGNILNIEEYCKKYNMNYNDVTSYKFLPHHYKYPTYHIVFREQKNEVIDIDFQSLFSKIVKDNVQPIIIKPYINKNLQENTFDRLVYTDVHVGMTPNENGYSLYGGKWDEEELDRRNIEMCNFVIANKKSRILYVNDKGDLMDGWDGHTVRRDHKLPQNMDNEKAFDVALNFKIKQIDILIKHYEEIIVHNICEDNHCFTNDVEVLTNNGWKLYHDVLDTDTIATFNSKTNEVEYQNPLDRIYNEINSDIEIHNYKSKLVDLSVTPKHRMYVKKNRYNKCNEEFDYFLSKDLDYSANVKFKVSASQNNPEYYIDDNFIKLCAWINTDGSVMNRKNSKQYVIYQSKEKGINKIQNILDSLGYKYDKREKKGKLTKEIKGTLLKSSKRVYEFVLNTKHTDAVDLDFISEMIPNKEIPTWINKLSKRQFDIYLKSYIDGDGSVKGDCTTSATIYGLKSYLDRLQELCTINNHRTKLSKNNRGDYVLSVVFDTDFSTFDLNNISKSIEKPKYTWCFTLPNSNMFVRKNGSVSVQGNSGSFGYVVNSAFKRFIEQKYANVKVFNHRKFINHYYVGKHAFLTSHGKDSKNLKFGFKPVLDTKQIEKIDQYLKHNDIYRQAEFIEFGKGDSHQLILDYATSDDFDYCNYLAFSPSSEWVQTNFKKGRSGFVFYTIDYNENKKDMKIHYFK